MTTVFDTICSICLDKTLQTYNFIQQFEMATQKLHKLINNLMSTFNSDKEVTNRDQAMYIMCTDEDETSLIFVQSKVKKPITKISFKCSCCKKNFNNLEVLVEHNRDRGLFTCKKCMFTSECTEDLLEHEISATLYKCDICSQLRCTQESLGDHELRIHSLHICKECGKSCKGLDKLLAHEQKHPVKNYCPKCGKTYITKEFYEKHVKLCLVGPVELHPMRSKIVKTYFCPVCDKGYSTQGGLQVHKRFKHGNAEYHVCKECGKKFTAPCFLKVHMVTHTKEKKFPCNLCKGRFVSKEALLYHKRRHTGEKPYTCNECGAKFVNASTRTEHIKFKHIGPTLNCVICPRKFATKTILKIHMNKHYNPTNKLYIGSADMPLNRRPTDESET